MEHPVTYIAAMAFVYTACTVRVTIFSIDGKLQLVSNFTELHALTRAAHSYALFHKPIKYHSSEDDFHTDDELFANDW